jgi:hypothetical protein
MAATDLVKKCSTEEFGWERAFDVFIAKYGRHLHDWQVCEDEKEECDIFKVWKSSPITPGKGFNLSFKNEVVGKIMINQVKRDEEEIELHIIFRNLFDPKEMQQAFHGMKNRIPTEWENLLRNGFSNIYAFVNYPEYQKSSYQSAVQYFEVKSQLFEAHNAAGNFMSRNSFTVTIDTVLHRCPADLPSFIQFLVDKWISSIENPTQVKDRKTTNGQIGEPIRECDSLVGFVFPILGNDDAKAAIDNIYRSLSRHLILKPAVLTNGTIIPHYQRHPVYDKYLNQKLELLVSRSYIPCLQVHVAPGFLYRSFPSQKTATAPSYTYRLSILLPPTIFDLIDKTRDSPYHDKEMSILIGSFFIVRMEYEYHAKHFQAAYDSAYPEFVKRCIQRGGNNEKEKLLEHQQYFLSLLSQHEMIITHEVCKYLFYDLLQWLSFDHTSNATQSDPSAPITGQEPSVITRAILDYVTYYSSKGSEMYDHSFTRLLSELEKQSRGSQCRDGTADDTCTFVQEFITKMLFGHYWILPHADDRITLHTIRHYYSASYEPQEIQSILFIQEYFLPSVHLYKIPLIYCLSLGKDDTREDEYNLGVLFHWKDCFISAMILHDFFVQECQLGDQNTQFHTNCQKISHWSACVNTWEKNSTTTNNVGKLPPNIQWNCELLWNRLLHWNTVSSFFCLDSGVAATALEALTDKQSSMKMSNPTKALGVFVFDLPRNMFLRAKDSDTSIDSSEQREMSAVEGMNAILDEMIIYPADGFLVLSYSLAQLLESNASMIFPFIFRLAFQNSVLTQDCLMEVMLRELMDIPKSSSPEHEHDAFYSPKKSKHSKKEKAQAKDLAAAITAYHNVLKEQDFQTVIEGLLLNSRNLERKYAEEEEHWQLNPKVAVVCSSNTNSQGRSLEKSENKGGLEEDEEDNLFDILEEVFLDTPMLSPLPSPPTPPSSLNPITMMTNRPASGPTIISSTKIIPKRSKPLRTSSASTSSSSLSSSTSSLASTTSGFSRSSQGNTSDESMSIMSIRSGRKRKIGDEETSNKTRIYEKSSKRFNAPKETLRKLFCVV